MTLTRALAALATVMAGVGASATAAAANPGFTVPSRNTQCAVLLKSQAAGEGAGLYCASSYIKSRAYDGQGVVKVGASGRARIVGSGNDLLLYIGGYDGDNRTMSKRPVLAYGKSFTSGAYRCMSRFTGLTCTRGAHGFFLSREARRLF